MKTAQIQNPTHKDASRRYVQGKYTPAQKIDFLFGVNRLYSLPDMSDSDKDQIASLMAKNRLNVPELVKVITAMSKMAIRAGSQISLDCFPGDQDALAGITPLHWEIKELVLEEILKRSPYHPPTEIQMPSMQERDNWKLTTINILIDLLENGSWDKIPETLVGIDMTARYYNENGAFPRGYSPRDTVRHYAEPDNRRYKPGGNDINPTIPDVYWRDAGLIYFLKQRHQYNLASPNPLSDRGFLERLLAPYLNQGLIVPGSATQEKFDEPRLLPGLTGPADHPHTHIATAYTHALKAFTNSSKSLAALSQLDYKISSATLHEIVDHLNLLEKALIRTYTAQPYNTMWGQGVHIWSQLSTITKTFQDLTPISKLNVRHAGDLRKVHEAFPAEPMNTIHFVAAEVIRISTEALATIQMDVIKDAEHQKVYQQIIGPAEQMAEESRANPAIVAMLNAYHQKQGDEWTAHKARKQESLTQAEQALAEMAAAGVPSESRRELARNPVFVARLDTAIKSLQHSDFLINAAYHIGPAKDW